MPFPPPISFTSLSIPTQPLLEDSCSRIRASRSPSLPTRPSQLEHFASIFLECLTSVSISSTQDYFVNHELSELEEVVEEEEEEEDFELRELACRKEEEINKSVVLCCVESTLAVFNDLSLSLVVCHRDSSGHSRAM
jgi:hypothetical protein